MIPLIIPPLSNLRVLVTRPEQQSESLCKAIMKLGGETIRFPVLDINVRDVTLTTTRYDLVIFVSANAVAQGASLLKQLDHTPRIAVIGNATAAALKVIGVDIAISAPPPFNSEALLLHAALQTPPRSILLIKGIGGRDLLRDTLAARGATVDVAEVYERSTAAVDNQTRSMLHNALSDSAIDVITITSIDVARAFSSLLDDADLAQAQACAVLAGSARIAAQLSSLGWRGEIIVSDSPDDESMIKALVRWHSRSRTD